MKLVAGYPGRAEAANNPRKARALGWKTTIDVMDYIGEFVRTNAPSAR
jgi:hypothetical protein